MQGSPRPEKRMTAVERGSADSIATALHKQLKSQCLVKAKDASNRPCDINKHTLTDNVVAELGLSWVKICNCGQNDQKRKAGCHDQVNVVYVWCATNALTTLT